MEGPTAVVLASPQKRSLDDDAQPLVSTPSSTSTPLTTLSSIDTPSPLKNVSTAGPTSSAPSQAAPAFSASTQQPAKRRKLTQQEKEAKAKARAEKKAQKEAEDKIKAEQKTQREEEKRIRDEEKRKKNEEKEEKKRAKELKQQQEEEERRKKERSQMRLNAFFTKPKAAADAPGKSTVDPIHNPSPSQTLAPDTTLASTNSAPPSPQKAIQKNAQNDYERFFLPFSLPAHAILAPRNVFMEDPETLAAARIRLDKLTAQEDVEMEPITPDTIRSFFPKRRRGLKTPTIAQIVDLVNGSAENPIDLTDDGTAKSKQPLELLKQISMKYLHFPEDVRPPYYGTYTKPHSPGEEHKLARNPISRGLPDINYDYDSEAEWEEPEEGEDLDSEGEEDLDEDGDEDMDGFLDDEDDPEVKRRLLSGDQDPVSTGLCWEDSRGVSRLNDGSGAISTEFKGFRMGFLLEPQPQSIDPFSTAYWAPEPTPVQTTIQAVLKENVTHGLMNPPRLPLTSRPVNGLLNAPNSTQKPSPRTTAKAVKPKRMIAADQLPAFKAEIEGQDLTKIGMIEALKKKFPRVPKDAITNTLTAVAKRVGASEKEKRWMLFN